jgi:hypothetical protein
MSEILRLVRQAIYKEFVEEGQAPDACGIAAATGLSLDQACDAMQDLADGHVIVLKRDTLRILFGPPFANMETGFRVIADGYAWFAPCAWDAFGIAAALHRDAEIAASCAHSGEPLACGVRDGSAYGGGVVHLLVPAARFWEDIVYT